MLDTHVRVKICGITRIEDAIAAVRSGADALGFVFYAGSPRFIHPEDARDIIRRMPPFVTTVGVFVNEERNRIEAMSRTSGIHSIQLHGSEHPEDCSGFDRPVFKALRVSGLESLASIQLYETAGILLDSAVPGTWGGTGTVPDWKCIGDFLDKDISGIRKRLILAGGLTAENVKMAVKIVRPWAVDVSSGVEFEPGIKNHEKMKEFTYAVHCATCA
ncbi:phosphoribosylanthranilate isomerase [Desulfomonile tiedjei]|uniref:N-(5'-phosphoribosyl)anthranilate isomerase n=1 Tax=Desulfomonile tiedjei (strain ATCC 49306 / DSM 6799 / DCB-1) TaxID=706587 RepID=I4CB12_DESTA|nr:phosphoribosylanthranilate isomerase [Desulfomonile tiedjei]AFM26753.1 phosphoribosylanthranilate isomerase [Desulfomonile tiedjei DSM 6799]